MFVYNMSTKTLRIMKFDAVGDLVWTFGCEMEGSRRGPLDTVSVMGTFQAQVPRTACKQGYHLTPSWKGTHHGDHALGSCQNHTHFGPQSPPSGIVTYLRMGK